MSAKTHSAQLLPARPNLENQRKRARALLKAACAQDPDALRRFVAMHPSFPNASEATALPRLSLHDAQLVIAREHGFASWARLKAHITAISKTTPLVAQALVAAANRALETDHPRPLYHDPLARELAGESGMALHAALRSASWPPNRVGPDPYSSILTRHFDDALQQAVRTLSIAQVVILGAALDTRAFRLEWPAGQVLFEVDEDAMFDRKETVLRRLKASPTCDRRVVRAELSRSWPSALLDAGFDRSRKAAILIQHRLVYLEATTVQRVFRALRTIAAGESWIGLDFISAETVVSPFMKPYLQKLDELGYPPWRFGVSDPEAFLAEHGWQGTSVVAGAPEANYGRWPYGYIPRSSPDRGIPRIYLAQGRMIGSGRR